MPEDLKFLFTNIHTHHGMYPLYQNQKPYFWENEAGGRLLVWSGEHYNLGNALGIVLNKRISSRAATWNTIWRIRGCCIRGGMKGS